MWTVKLVVKSKKGEVKRSISPKDRFHYEDLNDDIRLGCDEELWLALESDLFLVDEFFVR